MQVTKYFSKKVKLVSFVMSILVIYIHANNLAYYGIKADEKTILNITINILGGGNWGNSSSVFLRDVSILAFSL